MGFRMVALVKRKGSANYWFRHRVPKSVGERANGKVVVLEFPASGNGAPRTAHATARREITFSLGTSDLNLAKARVGLAIAHIQTWFTSLELGAVALTNKQIVALSGEVYRRFIERFSDEPGDPGKWAAFKAFNRAALEGRSNTVPRVTDGDADELGFAAVMFGPDLTEGVNSYPRTEQTEGLEARFGWLTDWVLATRALVVDQATRARLLAAVGQAATDAAKVLKRNANGDYSADPVAARFPEFSKAVSFDDLATKLRSERSSSVSSVSAKKTAIASLSKHLGHGYAARVTAKDIVAWKDGLVKQGLAPKTINDSYIASIRALLQFAVEDRVLPANVARGIGVRAPKQAGQRRLAYSDAEVSQLLQIAKRGADPARRWLVWLTAATGARVGEIAQLWADNIVQDGEHWVIQIRPAPDGGSLKNEGSERVIPVHPVLIAEGFLDFVRSKKSRPLFYRRSSGDPSKKHAAKGVANHLAAWIRKQGFSDPRKAPNHALRHWWKSAAIQAEISEGAADHLHGHAARSMADGYRHYKIDYLASKVALIPLQGGGKIGREG